MKLRTNTPETNVTCNTIPQSIKFPEEGNAAGFTDYDRALFELAEAGKNDECMTGIKESERLQPPVEIQEILVALPETLKRFLHLSPAQQENFDNISRILQPINTVIMFLTMVISVILLFRT